MSRSARTTALLLALGAAAALSALLWTLGGEPDAARPGPEVLQPGAVDAARATSPPVELIPPPELPEPEAVAEDTTVLWPVMVELELLQAAHLPAGGGVEPVGSGQTARLSGRLADASGAGLAGEVVFVAGANRGQALRCDRDGRFGSKRLYPGLSIVEVRRGADVLSRREVRLRQGKDSLLNIGYGLPAAVLGRVVDTGGTGIEGARVALDGQVAYSGSDGAFFVPRVAGGELLMEIEKPGYARFRQLYGVTAGTTIPSEHQPVFVLRPACSLAIDVENDVGGPGPVQVFLFSAIERESNEQRNFPWYELHPIEVHPGTRKVVEGLPTREVLLLSFRPGAVIPQRRINLRSELENRVALTLAPGATVAGRVLTPDGSPAAGAFVRLEAPDRVRATLTFFKQPSHELEYEVQPLLPPAVQETRADAEGRFSFSAFEDVSPARYLEARGADFRAWAGRVVRAGETEVELVLKETALGDAAVEIDFAGRWQGLPVDLVLDGVPYDQILVPPYEPFRIEKLLAGRWSLRVSWHGEPLVAEEVFDLRGSWSRQIALPQAAIDGQDEETWARAGREFPFGN